MPSSKSRFSSAIRKYSPKEKNNYKEQSALRMMSAHVKNARDSGPRSPLMLTILLVSASLS